MPLCSSRSNRPYRAPVFYPSNSTRTVCAALRWRGPNGNRRGPRWCRRASGCELSRKSWKTPRRSRSRSSVVTLELAEIGNLLEQDEQKLPAQIEEDGERIRSLVARLTSNSIDELGELGSDLTSAVRELQEFLKSEGERDLPGARSGPGRRGARTGGGPHGAIRRTRQGRADDPGPGVSRKSKSTSCTARPTTFLRRPHGPSITLSMRGGESWQSALQR